MSTKIGTIKLNSGGTYGEFLPRTIYEAIKPSVGSTSNLSEHLGQIEQSQSTMKEKLDTVETGANKYVHPTTTGNKHIPSGGKTGQILRWGADGTAVWGEDQNTTYSEATTSQSGLMSTSDKSKLDGIAAGANNYTHPTTSGNKHIPSGGSEGQILRWGADGTAVWGADNNTTYSEATVTSSGLMSATDKTKLDGIQAGANKYTHPDNANTRHVTDTQITTWTAKETTEGAQAKADAALASAKSYTDTKVANLVGSAPEALDTLAELAKALDDNENFATTVAENIGKKVDKVEGMGLSETSFTLAEKTKLAGVADNANYYVHPTTTGNKHIPSGGTSGQILRWSASGTAVWGAETDTTYDVVTKTAPGLVPQLPNETTTEKYLRQDGQWVKPPNTEYAVATTTSNGLMSSTDKTKLDGIETGANKYVHPTTTGNRHIPSGGSTGQILRWSADGTAVWSTENNTTYSVATTSANGLMSSTDKAKLDGATNANTASKIVMRDSSGNFSAGTITAALAGNASTATKLATARTVAIEGAVVGTGTFDGSQNLTISTTEEVRYARTFSKDNAEFFKLCTITVKSAYCNTPIFFNILGRNATGIIDEVSLKFTNMNNVTPTVASFNYFGSGAYGSRLRLYKVTETGSTYELWCQRGETYDTIRLKDLFYDTSKFTIDWSTDTAVAFPTTNFSEHICERAPVYGNINGNASTATKWATARKITLSGAVTGSVSLDGSADVSVTTTLSATSSDKVTKMTGYSAASAYSAIAATDSLNTAVGKLEKALIDSQSENVKLKRILSMLAVMNGFDIPLDSDMTTIESAFSTLFDEREETQFIYGANTLVIDVD